LKSLVCTHVDGQMTTFISRAGSRVISMMSSKHTHTHTHTHTPPSSQYNQLTRGGFEV